MSTKLIKKEGFTVEFDMTVSAETFEKGMQFSYKKNVKHMNIPGFRKGKAPRKYIERIYSEAVFYDDAVNNIFPECYTEAVKELSLEPVDMPNVDIKEIGSGKELVLNVKVDVKPDVQIGEYKGIEVTEKKYTVKADEVNAEIERMRDRNSRMITVEDRAVKSGDTAVIDYEGFVDGVAFAGGKGENHELVIGSNTFIPGFEDQIIGAKTGDEIDVNVTFPEEYHAEELKGKAAVFKVKVNQIKVKELPELDDEFAKDVSEFDTLDALKKDIKAKLTKQNEARAKGEMENEAIEKLVETLKGEIPNGMIESRAESLVQDFEMRLSQQGMPLDMYMKYTGLTLDAMKQQFKPQAEMAVKSTLVLEKVAQLEKIEIKDKDVDSKIEEMAKSYNMETDKLKELLRDEDKENIKKDLALEKAVKVILDNANYVKEAAKKPAAKKTTEKAATKSTATKTTTAKKTTAKKTTAAKETKETTAKKPAAKKTTTTKKAAKTEE
ncbi:MAG: trigger factor [Clostridia bacterium]|nr:trigger factor [Clostridia bacterium]